MVMLFSFKTFCDIIRVCVR